MKTKFILFQLLFSLYISQNIITSWHYDKVAMYDIQKINTFLANNFKMNLDLSITNETTTIKDIKLEQVQTNIYDSLINYNTGLLLLTPNKITLNFNFSYTNSDKGYKGTALLELKITTFKLKVKNDKNLGKVIFSIKMSTSKENYSIPGMQDKEFMNLLLDILFYEFNKNLVLSKLIPEKLESELYEYYTNFYKNKKEFKLVTNDFFGKLSFSMNNNKFMYFCEDPLGESKNSFCYIDGRSSIDDKGVDKTKVPLINEKFCHHNDSYMMFINNDLIKSILDYIVIHYTKGNAKNYNKNTNIKKLSYDFTVKSLKNYFNGLDSLDEKSEFNCDVYIENITLNKVIFRVKVNIDNQDKNNFEFRTTSNIKINIRETKSVRINFCLGETNTQDIEIITQQISVKDLNKLKKAIEESFDFTNNPICIRDDYITLRDYFNKISNIYWEDEGIYLEGDQLYQ